MIRRASTLEFQLILGLTTLSGVGFAEPQPVGRTFDAAICGDSVSTGAATHPELEFDSNHLWRVFMEQRSVEPKVADILPHAELLPGLAAGLASRAANGSIPPPQRLWPTVREYKTSLEWAGLAFLRTASHLYLDTEEYSWGHFWALAAPGGPAPANPDSQPAGRQVAIAAENGARAKDAMTQLARIIAAGGGRLPPEIFLFFTGNDLCASTPERMTSPADFEQQLFRALHFALRQGRPGEPVKIYVPAMVNVTQLISNAEIQTKVVKAFGGRISCAKLRENSFLPVVPVGDNPGVRSESALFAQFLPPNPAVLCPTLFSKNPETLGQVANRIRAFRSSAEAAVRRATALQKEHFPDIPLTFQYIASTADLQLTGDDIAQDCFHLSIRGQVRLAEQILKGISP